MIYQDGYKVRFRVSHIDCPIKYDCYQFPQGDQLIAFGKCHEIEGMILFVKLLAPIILHQYENAGKRKKIARVELPIMEEAVLRNRKTTREVKVTAVNLKRLDPAILRRVRKAYDKWIEKMEDRRIQNLMKN